MNLLEQLRSDLPDQAHKRRVYWPGDLNEAAQIVERARSLQIATLRYILALEKFEDRPKDGDKKQASYDLLVGVLSEVADKIRSLPAVVRSNEKSDD